MRIGARPAPGESASSISMRIRRIRPYCATQIAGSISWRRITIGVRSMNFKTLSIPAILVAALAVTACASTRTQQAPGEAIDDTAITASIQTKLIDDPVTKARQIEVETFRGVVQLSGNVDSTASKARAAEIASNTKGVTRVDNNLDVRDTNTTVGTTVDDSLLTTKVKAALVGNPVTKARQINVETLNGVVQLSGFVDSNDEISEATKVASSVSGVKNVENKLAVKPAS
jgi:hyperosmotically inducible protein